MYARAEHWLVIAAAVASTACASAKVPGPSGAGGDRMRLTTEQIEAARAGGAGTALSVVQRLRPGWLRTPIRSISVPTRIVVYLDRTYLGGVEALRSISARSIESMRWMSGPEATARLTGIESYHVAGAIVISQRLAPPE